MAKVLILGAGKIGALISGLLAESGAYEVHLSDVSGDAANAVVNAHRLDNLRTLIPLDACRGHGARRTAEEAPCRRRHLEPALLLQYRSRRSSAPRRYTLFRSDGGRGGHSRRAQDLGRRLSGVRTPVRPCTRIISIAANELIGHFDDPRAVKLRVGALPQHPNNVLKYSLTWSTEGLINEYGNPCEAIVDRRRVEAAPLEGLEEIEIDGTSYEAFKTSGRTGPSAKPMARGARTWTTRRCAIRVTAPRCAGR